MISLSTRMAKTKKKKNWQMQILARIWGNWNCQPLLVEVWNVKITLENSLTISYTVTHTLNNTTRQFHSQVFTQENEDIYTWKSVYKNVHCSFIHNSKNMEMTKMFVNWWVDKKIVVYSHHETLFSIERHYTQRHGWISKALGWI